VKIPMIYKEKDTELLNKKAIVMEYLEGIPLQELSKEERQLFAEYVIRLGLDSLLKLELVHGDLHAGNIIFIKTKDDQNNNYQYKLGVIDFGIIYRMDNAFKEQGMNLGFNFFFLKQSSREIAKQLLEIILIRNEKKTCFSEMEFLLDNISEMLDIFLNENKHLFIKIMELLEKMANLFHPHYLEKHGFTLHPDYYHLQLAMAMTHGITLELCGEQDFIMLVEQVWNKYYQ